MKQLNFFDIDWSQYPHRFLMEAARGNKNDLERTDLYNLIEELANRLDETINPLS